MAARGTLDDIELVLVDGNNLLHRTSGGIERAAQRALLAKLQAALPSPVKAVFMLDGHAAPGTPARERISGSLEVRHAGSGGADDAIVQLVTARPYAARAQTLVVTDDRALTERTRSAGGRTQRLGWLQALLERPPRQPTGSTAGAGRPVATPPRPTDRSSDDRSDRDAWRPGRGATRKKGNPRRGHPRPPGA